MQRIICDKRHEQLKMEFTLWSRAAVMQLIVVEFGVTLHVRSVGKYLARWGFTPQNPIKRAYEPSPSAVQAWLDDTYSAIAERAKCEGNEIHWGDVTAVVNTDVRGRSVASRRKAPVTMAVGGTRQKLSMIASIANQDRACWINIDGALSHEWLVVFFELPVLDVGRKVFLILGNLSVHRYKPVKTRLSEHKAQMEVFYLPSYSPELNPEVRLNANLKHGIRSKVPVQTKAKLQAATEEHINTIASKPERGRAYFQDPYVKYAALNCLRAESIMVGNQATRTRLDSKIQSTDSL